DAEQHRVAYAVSMVITSSSNPRGPWPGVRNLQCAMMANLYQKPLDTERLRRIEYGVHARYAIETMCGGVGIKLGTRPTTSPADGSDGRDGSDGAVDTVFTLPRSVSSPSFSANAYSSSHRVP